MLDDPQRVGVIGARKARGAFFTSLEIADFLAAWAIGETGGCQQVSRVLHRKSLAECLKDLAGRTDHHAHAVIRAEGRAARSGSYSSERPDGASVALRRERARLRWTGVSSSVKSSIAPSRC